MSTTTKLKLYWSPKPSEEISGTLINSGSGLNSFNTTSWKYQLETETHIVIITAPKMLQNVLRQVKMGTKLKIKYNGLAKPQWSVKSSLPSNPYHHFSVWQEKIKTCPTCGSLHQEWEEVIKQRIRNPQYVKDQTSIHNSSSSGGESRAESSSEDFKKRVNQAIESLTAVHQK